MLFGSISGSYRLLQDLRNICHVVRCNCEQLTNYGCILLCLELEKQVHKESYKLAFGLGNKWLIFLSGAEHMVRIFFSFVLQIGVSFTIAFVCRSQQMALLHISSCHVH